MATVGTQYPTTYSNTATGTSSSSSSSSTASSSSTGNTGLDTESAFLQLLVAQLKNQDPMQPVEGTTFVTQLAEFNDVTQNIGSREDLDAISEKLLGITTPPSAETNSSSSSSSSSSSNSSSSSSSGVTATQN